MKNPTASKSFDWKTYGLAPAILAIVTAIVYYPSMHYNFQFDDIANIKKFFAARNLSFSNWVFNGTRWISFWLNTINYKLGKHNPFYYRSFNICFHIITGLLLFFVTLTALSRLKKDNYFGKRALPISFMTALLFLLHPVQTQTVSYVIQGQLEGLAGMFTMLILLLFLHWATIENTILKVAGGAVILAIAFIACGTKEIIVVSPALLLLVDWFFVAQGDPKKIWSRAPFYLLYISTMGYYFMYKTGAKGQFIKTTLIKNKQVANNIGNVITQAPGDMITRFSYFMSQFKVILHYLWIFLWPFGISVDYDWKLAPTFFCYEVIAPLMLLIVIGSAIALLLYRDKTNVIAFGALWFFIGIAPRSSFIPSTELLADYKTYFSSYGWLLLLAIALIYFFEWFAKKVEEFNLPTVAQSPYLAIAFCMFFLGWGTYERNKVWRSSEEFWYNIVQNAPLKARAYNNYAVSLAENKHWEKAIPYLRKAIKMDAYYPDPWNNIAVCYNALNKVDIAIDQLYQAIRINPTYPEFYNNLASFLLLKKDYKKVCEMAQQAIHLRGYYGKAHFNWGRALYELGKKEEGWEKIKYSCCKGDYDTLEGFDTYGKISLELGKYQDAIFGFQSVCALNPRDKDARFNLGNALFCNQQYNEAKLAYQRSIQEDPTEYRCWFNLGETYAELNDRKEALKCFEKASPLAKQLPAIASRIAEYRKGVNKEKPLIA